MLRVKPGQIIRHKKTREPYLVIARTPLGPTVISLITRIDPAPVFIILPRVQEQFEPDFKMVDMTQDEAIVLETKLNVVDDVQNILKKTDLTGGVE